MSVAEGKFRSNGQPLRQSCIASGPQLVMCGVTELFCLRYGA